MITNVAYNLNDVAILAVIDELRAFFSLAAPYSSKLPANFLPPEFLYQESEPGVPTSAMNIVNEENLDDRKFPCIIVTGINGPMKPMAFGQTASKPSQTIETLPTTVTPVKATTTLKQVLATDFVNGKSIDGVILSTGDRILIKDQANSAENGVYIVKATGAPSRATDFNTAAQFVQYTVIPITQGTINGGKQQIQTSPVPVTLGTSAITYCEPEFDEYVEVSEPTITFRIQALSTSERDRLADIVSFAISNRLLVRGELEKKDIIFQPTSPGFIRNAGSTEEGTYNGTAYQTIYKVDLASTLFLQWNYRVLREQYVAEAITPVRQFSN